MRLSTQLAYQLGARPLATDADDLVLLTGSVARGEVRANSDIDLLVLTKRRRGRTGNDALSFPSVLGESLDSERHGVHFNVEYVAVDQVRRLASILRPAAGRTGSVVTLLCDGGERYAHTYYSDAWVADQGLDLSPHVDTLRRFAGTGEWHGRSGGCEDEA